jgi:hypothetical protein
MYMKTRKNISTCLLVLMAISFTAGCGSGGGNNSDFFVIETTILVNGFVHPEPSVHVSGVANSPTTFCTQFPNGTASFDTTTDGNGQFTVQDAAAGGPSCSWTISRFPSAQCSQFSSSNIFVTVPGGTFNVQCALAVNTFTANPSKIDPTAPPSTITITGKNMYPTYAMPQVTIYDQNQTALLTVNASSASGDGTSLTFPASQLTFGDGGYGAIISVKQSDGTWLTVGGAGIRFFTAVTINKCRPPMPCC